MSLLNNLKHFSNFFSKEIYVELYRDKIERGSYDENEIRKSFAYTYNIPNINIIFLKNFCFLINVYLFDKIKIIYAKIKFFFFLKKKTKNKTEFKINFISINLKEYSDTYKKNGYVFVENFLSKDSYKTLLKNWPADDFFPPRLSPIKYYSFSFGFDNQDTNYLIDKSINEKISSVKYLDYNLALKELYSFLMSDRNEKNFSQLCSNDERWKCYLIFSTLAKENGYLLPHFDVVNYNQNVYSTFNVSLFLDGNNENPVNSGALGLYHDNKFQKPIFIPNNLKNSLLIYDTKKNFFHGFPRIGKGGHRKTINMAFLKNYI